jgi:hypothetical protein
MGKVMGKVMTPRCEPVDATGPNERQPLIPK